MFKEQSKRGKKKKSIPERGLVIRSERTENSTKPPMLASMCIVHEHGLLRASVHIRLPLLGSHLFSPDCYYCLFLGGPGIGRKNSDGIRGLKDKMERLGIEP